MADDVGAIAPIIVSIANRFAEYEASGSTAWDSTMDVRCRPAWLREAATIEYEPKKLRRSSSRTELADGDGAEDDDEQKTTDDDERLLALGMPVNRTADLTAAAWESEDGDGGPQAAPSPLSSRQQVKIQEHFEQLKRRQAEQMATLSEQHAHVLAQQERQLDEQQLQLLTQQDLQRKEQRARQLEVCGRTNEG